MSYWIYSHYNDSVVMTLKGAAPNVSSAVDAQYPLSDLMFRNDTSGEIVSIETAVEKGWIQGSSMNDVVYYYNTSAPAWEVWQTLRCIYAPDLICEDADSWSGYFVRGTAEEVSMLRWD
jgi:hypothetical protein